MLQGNGLVVVKTYSSEGIVSHPQGGPLAQSVERRADNAKVMSSSLIRTINLFSFFLHLFSP